MEALEKKLLKVWRTLGKKDIVAGVVVNKKGKIEIISISNRSLTLIDANRTSRYDEEDEDEEEELTKEELDEYIEKETDLRARKVNYYG